MTDEKPSIAERYVTAERAGDVITAAGWVAQRHEIALMLWSVMYEGRASQKDLLAEKLGNYLNNKKAKNRNLKGDAWKIAAEMVAWKLHGVCEPCEGRGKELIQNTRFLSDNLCHHCHGSGKRPYPREAAHVWLESEMARMEAYAGGEMMRRLAKDMEL